MKYSKILNMKQEQFEFVKDNNSYNVFVTYKYQRNIYFRYKEDGFHISAPYFTRRKTIEAGIDKFFDKLLKQHVAKTSHFSFEDDYVYLLGEKVAISSLNIKNDEELHKYLKKYALEIISQEVEKYRQIMDISTIYKIRIADTTHQYGSNSKKTHTLSFQTSLIHYSLDIIDTVVVHELAHEFERNHQKHFYEIVYKYCPNYKPLQRKLKRGIHQ